MDEIAAIFKKAISTLDDAEFNFKHERHSVSINRSYYACFYAAKALLLKKGIVTKTHSGTIHKFGLEYVINGNFDKHIGKFFSILEKDRGKADYDYSYEATENKAKKDLNNAKKFVKECEKFL